MQRAANTAASIRKTAASCGFLRAAPGRVVTVAVGGGRYGLQAADVAVVRSLTWIASRRVYIISCRLRASNSPSSYRACDVSTAIVERFA
jgi:hypothetical protein